jgi:hypothetical protein
MSRKWVIAFMVFTMGVFTASGARADLGDIVFDIIQALPQDSGHTAGTILNPEGRGDALIFPYYDVREIDGKTQDFYFTIINDDGDCESVFAECHKGMAAKVRFREGDKGEEVFNIDAWLSRGDVWVGALTHNASLSSPYGARITSPDWVIIAYTSNTFTLSKALQGGFDLPTTAYIPAGSNNLMGYIEVIGEERTHDFQASGTAARVTPLGDPLVNNDAPNSLMGYAYIVRAADGVSFAYNATAIANFSRNQGSLFYAPGSTNPTLSHCEDTLDELEFQIAKKEVRVGYNVEDATLGKFSLILTFPTKRFHFCGNPNYTIKGDATSPCGSTYPQGSPWAASNANSTEPVSVTIFDQNENRVLPAPCPFSPCPAESAGLPFGVNVIGLYKGTPPTVPAVGNRNNLALSTTTFETGHLSVGFPNGGHVQANNPKITKLVYRDEFLNSFGGLPVLGLMLQELENGAIGGHYGGIQDVFYKTKWPGHNVIWGSISGQVVRDSDGTGIQNAWINVYTRSWNYLTTVWTNSHGNYTVGELPAGSYYLQAWHDKYIGEYYNSAPTQGAATSVGVAQGNDTPDINFSLSQYDSIYVSKESSCSGHSLCFQNIQNGIASASVPTEVKITQETYNENIILDLDQVITLQGGWDTSFTSCSSYTTIHGSITITNGTMIIENIILQ